MALSAVDKIETHTLSTARSRFRSKLLPRLNRQFQIRPTRATARDLHKSVDPCTWRVALLVLLTTSVPQAKAESPDEQALRLLNHYRQLAGLTPVKLDRKLSAGCMEHANYMVHNQGTDAMGGLNPHTQRSNLPGASAAGAACAKAADLFPRVTPIWASRSTPGWPACITARRLCPPSRWDADGRLEVRKRQAQSRYLARRVSGGQADRRSARLWR